MERRDFIEKSFILAFGVAGAGAFLEACQKSSQAPPAPTVNFTIDISTPPYTELQQNGGYAYYGPSNIIIARDSSGNFIALYDICTHKGCTILFNGNNEFPCPCHGSVYNENGNVIHGPATQGVKKYNTSLNGTKLNIYG